MRKPAATSILLIGDWWTDNRWRPAIGGAIAKAVAAIRKEIAGLPGRGSRPSRLREIDDRLNDVGFVPLRTPAAILA